MFSVSAIEANYFPLEFLFSFVKQRMCCLSPRRQEQLYIHFFICVCVCS